MRSERRGMAGTLRTRAILHWNSRGSFGIVSAAVGQAPSPQMPPRPPSAPHVLAGLFIFAVARNSPPTFASLGMPPFLYRCPNTGYRVQGFVAEDVSREKSERYETVTCIACQRVHLVNPASGKVLGAEEE